jgi:hypothetical protein
MVQIGNYNYSDYYSTGAYAPREGTLSYAEFDPEAYLTARPDVAQSPGFTGRSQYRPDSLFMRQYGRAPTRDEALYAHYQGLYPSSPPSNSYQDNTSNRPLILSVDQQKMWQRSRGIKLLEVL